MVIFHCYVNLLEGTSSLTIPNYDAIKIYKDGFVNISSRVDKKTVLCPSQFAVLSIQYSNGPISGWHCANDDALLA